MLQKCFNLPSRLDNVTLRYSSKFIVTFYRVNETFIHQSPRGKITSKQTVKKYPGFYRFHISPTLETVQSRINPPSSRYILTLHPIYAFASQMSFALQVAPFKCCI